MSSPEAIMEAIKQRREARDRIMLQDAIPVLDNLKNMVNRWVDDEFKDFEDEIEQVDDSAPREAAIERISRFRTELATIRNEQLHDALIGLDELVESIKQKFDTADSAIAMLVQKVPPILRVMWNLFKARENLDSMADMIPPLVEIPRVDIENGERE